MAYRGLKKGGELKKNVYGENFEISVLLKNSERLKIFCKLQKIKKNWENKIYGHKKYFYKILEEFPSLKKIGKIPRNFLSS